jgi:hypothetical protein
MLYQIALHLGPIVACLISAYLLFIVYQRKQALQGRALVHPLLRIGTGVVLVVVAAFCLGVLMATPMPVAIGIDAKGVGLQHIWIIPVVIGLAVMWLFRRSMFHMK